MRIVYLEDNPVQAETMLEEFRRSLRIDPQDILRIKTEAEFLSRIDEIRQFGPDLAVLDVMVIWSNPSPKAPPQSAEAKKDGYFEAGVRCAMALRQALPELAVILYTIVEATELRSFLNARTEDLSDVVIVPKEPDLKAIMDAIRAVAGRSSSAGFGN